MATVLNEFAAASRWCLRIHETAVPIRDEVRGVCELLGLDPLYMANEGKLIAVVPGPDAARALAALRSHPYGRTAAIIGEVAEAPEETVVLTTPFGGSRILDMLVGEQLRGFVEDRGRARAEHRSEHRRDGLRKGGGSARP